MVEQKVTKILEDFTKENPNLIKRVKKDKDMDQKQYSGIYIFISFDLVNSTRYKSIEQSWPNVINFFYDQIYIELKKNEPTNMFNIWKYVGDEVLFFGKVLDTEDLIKIPNTVLKTMNKVTQSIFNKYVESEGILGIKATIWCADIIHFNDDVNTRKRQNYLLEKTNFDNYNASNKPPTTVYDFLGPEIDLGFRLAKNCAKKNQIVISAELTFLILLCIEQLHDENMKILYLKKFRIMEMLSLKGIWYERNYPVIWYREQWEQGVFEYDDPKDQYDFYYENYIRAENTNVNVYNYLSEILKSVGQLKNVTNYYEKIQSSSQDKLEDLYTLPLDNPVEIHLVCIVFDNKDQVLLFKRGENKKSPEKYDFGCVSLKFQKNIKETLIEYYCQLLDISESKFQLLEDKGGNPSPIATFNYTKRNNTDVSGFIFTAKVNDEIKILEEKLEKNEYSDYVLKKQDNKEELFKIDMFDNSVDNIEKSFNLLNKN